MDGLEEFERVFGSVTVMDVVVLLIALAFLYTIYKRVSKVLVERYEARKEKDKQLKTALDAVSKYPEYRAQSIKIQKELQGDIDRLRKAQEQNTERLEKMESDQIRRERNRIRDRLLQSYRYYTNPASNPDKSWNRMEAEAFWELFGDYERAGGNGYMHTIVQPAMNLLNIVEVGDGDGSREEDVP